MYVSTCELETYSIGPGENIYSSSLPVARILYTYSSLLVCYSELLFNTTVWYLSSGTKPLMGLKELFFGFFYFYFYFKKSFYFCFISPLRIGAFKLR